MSATAHLDWAAAKSIKLAVAGGASITLEGGGITFACPGKIAIHASALAMAGPSSLSREMNTWPTSKFDQEIFIKQPDGKPVSNVKFQLIRADGSMIPGVTRADGGTGIQKSTAPDGYSIYITGGAG